MPFPVDEKWIIEAEKKLGVTLPLMYRQFISKENGGHITINEETWDLYPIWDKSDRKRLKRTCNDIVHETEVCHDCFGFPSRAVAIANNGCGDQLILLPEKDSKKLGETIYFWSHETGEYETVLENLRK